MAVNAKDFARRKVRADMGTTYDDEVLRQIDEFRERGLYVGSVVITQWTDDNKAAAEVKERFEKLGIRVYRHFPIPGYPSDVERIVSDEGYGANEYVETSRNLVVVTAPGPGSGKMATCLSQLYHDHKRGIESGYAKWETFPIWNIPLDHPVNIAYEAATADLDDVNMIDPFHLEAYGIKTVNYNRDVEIFPVLNRLFREDPRILPVQEPHGHGRQHGRPLHQRRRGLGPAPRPVRCRPTVSVYSPDTRVAGPSHGLVDEDAPPHAPSVRGRPTSRIPRCGKSSLTWQTGTMKSLYENLSEPAPPGRGRTASDPAGRSWRGRP